MHAMECKEHTGRIMAIMNRGSNGGRWNTYIIDPNFGYAFILYLLPTCGMGMVVPWYCKPLHPCDRGIENLRHSKGQYYVDSSTSLYSAAWSGIKL